MVRHLSVLLVVAALLPLAGATSTPPMPGAPPVPAPPPDRGCADVPDCERWTYERVDWAYLTSLRLTDYAIDEALRQTTWAFDTHDHVVGCHLGYFLACQEVIGAHTPLTTFYVPVGFNAGVWMETNGCPGWQPGSGGCGNRPPDERVL